MSSPTTIPLHTTEQVGGHTPGPWFAAPWVDDLSVYVSPTDEPLRRIRVAFVDNGFQFMEEGSYHRLGSEQYTAQANAMRSANARLISAAPDLLAALRTISDMAGTVTPDTSWGSAIMSARAALAKATGGAS